MPGKPKDPPSKGHGKPSIGRIVHVIGGPAVSNGADVAPAIITRVWSKQDDRNVWTINATVFPDNGVAPAAYASSVFLYESEEAARAGRVADTAAAAFWPSHNN